MGPATVISIVLMVLVLIGMLIVKKTMAASPMLQPILFLCVALELGLVIFVFYKQLFSDGSSGALENAMRKDYAKGAVAGEFLKSKAGGKKLLLISVFGSKTSKQYQGFLKGLQEKYGAVTEDETKERNNEADGGEGVTIDDVKEVLAKHTDAGIIVFYSFIPADYDKLDTKAVFFLSDTGSADPKKIKKDIEGGKILGVIIGKQNTGLKPSDPVEKDPAKAFEKRYVLVEKSNLKANDKLF